MNKLTEHLLENYKPTLALICYTAKDQHYLEAHPIDANGNMGEGKPLQVETLYGILDLLYDDQSDKIKMGGYVPDCLLSWQLMSGGDYRLTWFEPEQLRHIHFAKSLSLPSGTAPCPPLVFTATRKTLRVFALKENRRPEPDTLLLRAPFHNVNYSGEVCLGNATAKKPEDKEFTSFIKYWQDMFWGSEFTHITGASPTKSNVNLLWKKMIADNTLTWTGLDELIPSNQPSKLKELIK